MFVARIENVRYLSGFSGSSAFLVITPDSQHLVTDGRYREQASIECAHWDIHIYTSGLFEEVASLCEGSGKVGFESTIPYESFRRLEAAVPEGTELLETRSAVEALRAIKEPGELELMEAAVACAADAYGKVRPMIAPGATERDIAAELGYRMMKAGADKEAFDTVVASGPNSSLPHAGVTDRTMKEGDLVVVDFGARFRGYNCDVTRTIMLGEPSGWQREALSAVEAALDAAIAGLRAGMEAREADALAREVIEARGLGESFGHGLGHGVGLEVHESPRLGTLSTDTLGLMMVFTVEPGVYIDGKGGVRVEEMVLLLDSGPRVLTSQIPR